MCGANVSEQERKRAGRSQNTNEINKREVTGAAGLNELHIRPNRSITKEIDGFPKRKIIS